MCHSVKFPWLFFSPVDLFVFQFILPACCPCQCYFLHLSLAPSSQVFPHSDDCFCMYLCSFLHSWSVQCLMLSLLGSQSIVPSFCAGIFFPGKNKALRNFWFNKYFMFFHPSSMSPHLSWLLSQNLTWWTNKSPSHFITHLIPNFPHDQEPLQLCGSIINLLHLFVKLLYRAVFGRSKGEKMFNT